ncbi:hypothetical protein ANN_21941 [Periplaneta americana]|uniref:Uncharacterized protein n=1 Tax=Periplaneta americana TaxID=6978 RepID=A0ABQ8S747_PERAM|nr:hypothetical protein ANN_21941 [Periplaneta americana]
MDLREVGYDDRDWIRDRWRAYGSQPGELEIYFQAFDGYLCHLLPLKKMAELAIESLEANLQLTWLRTRKDFILHQTPGKPEVKVTTAFFPYFEAHRTGEFPLQSLMFPLLLTPHIYSARVLPSPPPPPPQPPPPSPPPPPLA